MSNVIFDFQSSSKVSPQVNKDSFVQQTSQLYKKIQIIFTFVLKFDGLHPCFKSYGILLYFQFCRNLTDQNVLPKKYSWNHKFLQMFTPD